MAANSYCRRSLGPQIFPLPLASTCLRAESVSGTESGANGHSSAYADRPKVTDRRTDANSERPGLSWSSRWTARIDVGHLCAHGRLPVVRSRLRVAGLRLRGCEASDLDAGVRDHGGLCSDHASSNQGGRPYPSPPPPSPSSSPRPFP